jgi:hypothetical protein
LSSLRNWRNRKAGGYQHRHSEHDASIFHRLTPLVSLVMRKDHGFVLLIETVREGFETTYLQ